MIATIYGIANCDQVRRTRAWWAEAGRNGVFCDLRRAPLSADHLDRWIAAVGVDRLLNRQGTTWRKLDDSARASAEAIDGARALMQAQPTLIKRPVVEIGEHIIVGFDPVAWTAALENS